MGVLVYDSAKCGLVYPECLTIDSVFGQLLRYQILLGNLLLFLGKISGDVYHLHTVEQGRLDGRGAVCRGDEQNV